MLVHERDWETDSEDPPVTYVAEDWLTAPEQDQDGKSWMEVHGEAPLEHR